MTASNASTIGGNARITSTIKRIVTVLDDAGEVAAQHSQHCSEGQGKQRRAQSDEQLDLRAVHDPGEDIAAELVGAQQVPR